MKPTKSRIFCQDSNRLKTLFETEKKALTFIKFNSEEIALESGHSPVRAYFCISCNGWHVTSKKEPLHEKSHAEVVLQTYKEEKEKWALFRAKNAANRKLQVETLLKHLKNIDEKISLLESGKETNPLSILNAAMEELKIADEIVGCYKRKQVMHDKLNRLKEAINPSVDNQS